MFENSLSRDMKEASQTCGHDTSRTLFSLKRGHFLKIKRALPLFIAESWEDTEHFLLLCSSFTEYRRSLLAGANDVLQTYGYSEAPGYNILQLLLYGDKNLPLEANVLILNLTIKFILETERFD